MRSPFSLEGEIGRARYAMFSAAAFFSQHALMALLLLANGRSLLAAKSNDSEPWWFWINPLRAAMLPPNHMPLPGWSLWLLFGYGLLVAWLLVALAFRRARDADASAALATLAIVPGLQLAVIAWLSIAQRKTLSDSGQRPASSATMARIVVGLLAGIILGVSAEAIATLFFRVYGLTLFVATPFMVAITIAFIINWRTDVSGGATIGWVMTGLCLGALVLLGIAFEGFICLAMASPIIGAMGLVGAMLGRAMARAGQRRSVAMSMSLLPLLLLAEAAMPPRVSFESVESIEVAAPPEAVWDSVVHMHDIPEAPAAPFRWGLAYPMSGTINGEGVGAVRRGVFSTGVAYERVTEWAPPRALTFDVLTNPPTMRELSPYQHVNAPHVWSAFRTLDARFTVTSLGDGRSRLTLTTHHELDLEPALYWTPIAQVIIHVNKERVLRHFRAQAENASH